MVYINLINNTKAQQWFANNTVHAKGYLYYNSKLYQGFDLCELFTKIIIDNKLSNDLPLLNGNFACVAEYNNVIYLIVDKLRTIPLFYYIRDSIYITDVCHTIIENKTNELEYNKVAKEELLSLGYLSCSSDTLIKDIHYVRAGYYILISQNLIEEKCYFTHIFPKLSLNQEEIISKSKDVVENAFKRMINSIENKRIVIPLSGGYDSRLIACLCKKYGLNNTLCYTYGKASSWEVITSKKVAEKLGFKWYFIEYNDNTWSDFINSQEFTNYMEFSGNLTSNPCFQDAPAILYLKNQNIINSEDIIVAGHSGDMLGGSHIPISLLKEISFSSSGITNILLKCKYHLNALSDYSGIIEKNNDYFDKFDISNIDSFLDIYDLLWNIKYRQSNFIVNSVRVYDFWGFDWRLPLWDDEYAILWCSIKWDYKFNSYIYNKFMFQTYFYPMNVDYIKEIKPSFFKKHTSVFIKDFLKKIVFFRRKNNENYFAPVINLLDTNNYKHKYGLKKVNLKNVDSLIACRYITHIEKIIKHEVSD